MRADADALVPPSYAPQLRTLHELPKLREISDYVPNLVRNSTIAELSDRVRIPPPAAARSGDGVVFDVVVQNGALDAYVQLPAGRALCGFISPYLTILQTHQGLFSGLDLSRVR
jgi:hypothetical protein